MATITTAKSHGSIYYTLNYKQVNLYTTALSLNQRRRSIKVRKHFQQNRKNIIVKWLPKGLAEFDAVEECWRQGKDDLFVSKYYPRFTNIKNAIAKYYRTKQFKLEITRYLLRNLS